MANGLARHRDQEITTALQRDQMLLVFRHIRGTVMPAVLLALLVLVIFGTQGNLAMLALWAIAVVTIKLHCSAVARRFLKRGIERAAMRGLRYWLFVSSSVYGMAWGALLWIVQQPESLTNTLLALIIVSGVLGSMLGQLSPVFPAFLYFVASILLTLLYPLWVADVFGHSWLGFALILSALSVISQARSNALLAEDTVLLRFENRDLIAQLRAEKQTAQHARNMAEKANLDKSRFLAAVSHDLRQPIHAQALFLELLRKSPLSEQQHIILEKARCATAATSSLLNALLDLSRVETEEVTPEPHPFALQGLLRQLENELALQADHKNIVYRSRETPCWVLSDPLLLERILRNLISNAIRYTKRGGVLIGCRKKSDHTLWIEVWDTGVGIEPHQASDIFREFHQLPSESDWTGHKGFGLGLAIADRLSRMLGHTLAFSSKPGRGSVFRLSVTLAPPGNSADPRQILASLPLPGSG